MNWLYHLIAFAVERLLTAGPPEHALLACPPLAMGAIAAAAASVLGSIMGGRAAKKQQQAAQRQFNQARGLALEKLAPANTQYLGGVFYPGAFRKGETAPAEWTPPARAGGGPVKAGHPYLTGERGPEKLTGTRERSKDRLGLLNSAMLDESNQPRRVPSDHPANRLEGYPTSGPADRYSMSPFGLGQPHTEAPNSVSDFLSMIVNAMASDKQSLPHRAKGGPVKKGKATVVGEKGPEVIVPKKDGTVIPHKESGLADTGAAAAPPGAAPPAPDALPMGADMGGAGLAGAPDADGDEGMPLPGFGSNGGPPPGGGDASGASDPLVQFVLEAVLEKLAGMMGGGGAMGAASAASMGSPPGPAVGGGTMPPGSGGGLLSGGGGAPPLPARAAGGPVQQGQPTLVGERGPEQLVPQPQATGAPAGPVRAPVLGGNAMIAQAPTAGPTPSIGSMVTGHLRDYLTNPGKLSSTTYERGQEQANQGEMMAQNAVSGLAGHGIDLASTGVGALRESAALSAGKQRNEVARDYGTMSETMRRADIAQASQIYQSILSQIFGMQQAEANAALGQGMAQLPSTQYPSGYDTAATGLGVLANYLSSSNASTSGASAASTGGNPVSIGGASNL